MRNGRRYLHNCPSGSGCRRGDSFNRAIELCVVVANRNLDWRNLSADRNYQQLVKQIPAAGRDRRNITSSGIDQNPVSTRDCTRQRQFGVLRVLGGKKAATRIKRLG